MCWLTHVNDLSAHPKVRVVPTLSRQPGNQALTIGIFQVPAAAAAAAAAAAVAPCIALRQLSPTPTHDSSYSVFTHHTCEHYSVFLHHRRPPPPTMPPPQVLTKDAPGASLVSGTWKRRADGGGEGGQEELVAVDLRYVLGMLDGVEGSPFLDEMDRWGGHWGGGVGGGQGGGGRRGSYGGGASR